MGNGGGVLVAGAINTDLVARVTRAPAAGETVTGTDFDIFGGGKGANQALAAARSGAETTMLGALGADDFGRQRLADLVADGVDVGSVLLAEGVASGVALIIVDASGENRIAYVPGATSTISVETAVSAFERARPAIVLSTLELPLASLGDLFSSGKRADAKVICNATPEPSSGRVLLPLVDCLIVNETEALGLLDEQSATDWAAISTRLRALGPNWVVITIGPDGAIANFDGLIALAPAPKVTVVDTTGAGDAFCGAFAARLAEGDDPLLALRAGVAAGTLAVTVAGAQRSMPQRAEVDRMTDKVAIREF